MAKKAKKTLDIGCYLDGCSRNIEEMNHDTLDLCLDLLKDFRADKPLQAEIEAYLEGFELDQDTESDPEIADDLIQSAIDSLSAYCADYTWLGFYESDFGVWISHESLDDDIRYGELISVDDRPAGYTGLCVSISDHGNVTLYRSSRGRLYEIWSIV